MKKRILIYTLVALLLLSHVTQFVSAAGSHVEEKYITVDSRGTFYSQRVYEDSDGTIFVPISMLSQFGAMRCSEGTSQYTFYYNNETAVSAGSKTPIPGARRIFIDKSGKTGAVVCYTSRTNYSTIESIKFSDSHTINGKLYLPLAEFLPLFDAKVEITTDGIVHIYRNPVPLYSALLSNNLDLWYFDSEKLVGDDFIKASGLIVDSVLGLKFNRLDFITNSGAIKDYSSLFKKLLTDNETYLSAFDKTETPIDKALSLTSDSAGELDDFVGGVKNVLNGAKYVFSEHETYKEFSSAIKEEFNADVVEGAIKVVEFADVYISQVDDHRNMLDAVYGGGSNPAAIAANEVYTLYGKQTASQITSAATSALRDYITGELSSAVTKELGLTPYKIAFSAVKLILPGAVAEFSKGAQLFYLDKVLEDAYTVTNKRLDNIKFDETSLEDLRLSLIMTLVASKFGYETYYGEDAEEVGQINEWLEELYLAADSVECVSKGYYAEKKAELAKSCSYIKPEDSVSSGDSSSSGGPSSSDDNSADIVDSGTCGDNLTWTLDEDGVLTISGEGSMKNYGFPWQEAPWHSYCETVSAVVIEDGITNIGNEAFLNCANLISISIPDSVTCIGDESFYGCENLTSIEIPDSVTSIGSDAFGHCESLTSITIPNGVTRIEFSTFGWCYNLTSVTIPDSVTSIGSNAFWYCESLASITIPDSVTSIDAYAFSDCESLTSITIPDSVTRIGECAFMYCGSLTDVYYGGSESEWNNIDIEGNNSRLLDATIHYGVSSSASEGLLFELIDYSAYSVTGIGTCQDTDIVIPSTYQSLPVTNIGSKAFDGCVSLTSITIPDSVTSIGWHAFWYCASLTSVTIGDSVTSIGSDAFSYCASLTSIIVDPNNTVYHSAGNCLIETTSKTLVAGCKTSTIPSDGSVTNIGDRAFAGCESLTSITIPDSVTNIGDDAFGACYNLTSIEIPDSVTSIGKDAFGGCVSLKSVIFGENSQLTSIGDRAFDGCVSLTSITIPSSVTVIGEFPFHNCYVLSDISFEGTIEQWNAINKDPNGSDGFRVICTDGSAGRW